MALADFLRSWQNRRTPTSTSPNQNTASKPAGNTETTPVTDPNYKGYSESGTDASGRRMVTLSNGITLPYDALMASRAAASKEQLGDQYNQEPQIPEAYRAEFQALQRKYFSGGPITPENNARYVQELTALQAKYGIGDEGQVNRPAQPAAGSLDVYNPGPYIAQLLRSQIPGYVFGTKVPRPNQVTMSEFLRLNPTQQQVLASYVSAIGIPPEDFLREMEQYWLGGRPSKQISWMS